MADPIVPKSIDELMAIATQLAKFKQDQTAAYKAKAAELKAGVGIAQSNAIEILVNGIMAAIR